MNPVQIISMNKMGIKMFLFLILFQNAVLPAQNKIPPFNPKPFSITVPSEIKGIFKDSLNLKEDNYYYKLEGVSFEKTGGAAMPTAKSGFAGKTSRSTPFEVLTELFYAWQTGNQSLILELFTPESAGLVSSKFADTLGTRYRELMMKETSPKFISAYRYKEGYMVLTEFKSNGIESAYLIMRDGRYFIQPMEVSEERFHNIEMYFSNNPQPFLKPDIKLAGDSVISNTETRFKVNLKKAGNYIVMFTGTLQSMVFVNMKDNYAYDLNPTERVVEFDINLSWFLPKTGATIYAIESNFPISAVSEKMIREAVPIQIKFK